jgi:HK97 family phage major capsid protein
MLDVYTQRRQVVAAQVRDLINARGPRTAMHKASLEALLSEDAELESGVNREYEKRKFAALAPWLRWGELALQGEHHKLLPQLSKRDMSEAGLAFGTASGGGILVPVDFNHMVTSAMKDYSPLLSLATIIPTSSGAPRPFPTDLDANISGEILNEGVQANLADVSAPSQVILSSYRFSSKMVRLSRELLADQEVDLPSYLARVLGVRLARIMSTSFTSSASAPTGFMNSSTIINAGTAVGSAANNGTGGANTIGSSDLALLESAVDVAYRPSAKFMVHPSTLQSMRAALDKQGHVLWPGLHNSHDGVNRLLNYEVVTNPAMDQLQTVASSPVVTVRPIAFADWSRFTIRMCPLALVRFEERFAELFQIAFIAYCRADGNFTDAGSCAAYLETNY